MKEEQPFTEKQQQILAVVKLQQIHQLILQHDFKKSLQQFTVKLDNQEHSFLISTLLMTVQSSQFTQEKLEDALNLAIKLLTNSFDDQQSQMQLLEVLINKIVAVTSIKYMLMIYKSHIVGIQSERKVEKFKYLRMVWILCNLCGQKLIGDVEECYGELVKVENEIRQEGWEQQQLNAFNHKTLEIRVKCLSKLLNEPLPNAIQQNIIDFSSTLIDHLIYCEESQQYQHQLIEQNFKQLKIRCKDENFSLKEAIFEIIERLIVIYRINLINCALTAVYMDYFLKISTKTLQNQTEDNHLQNIEIFSKNTLIVIIIGCINKEFPSDLTKSPTFTKDSQKLFKALIIQLCKNLQIYKSYTQFQNNKHLSNYFHQNFNQIFTLIQKLSIYHGCIEPKSQLYTVLSKFLNNLNLLHPSQKEYIFSQLLKKHANYHFKSYCITQYRKLLNPTTSILIWRKSNKVIFNELSALQPNFDLDYIGHLISLGFYWKAVAKRVKDDPLINKTNINIQNLSKEFQQSIHKLKIGLQHRLQSVIQSSNELQRNQINLCLYRIDQILKL